MEMNQQDHYTSFQDIKAFANISYYYTLNCKTHVLCPKVFILFAKKEYRLRNTNVAIS